MAGKPQDTKAVLREVSKLVLNPAVRDVKSRTVQALVVYALMESGAGKRHPIPEISGTIAKCLGIKNLPNLLLEEGLQQLEEGRVVTRHGDEFGLDADRVAALAKAAQTGAGRVGALTSEFLSRVEKYAGKLDDHQKVFAVKALDIGLFEILKGLAGSSVELFTGKPAELGQIGLLDVLRSVLEAVREPVIERADQVRAAIYQAILDLFAHPSAVFSENLVHIATNYVMVQVLSVDPSLTQAKLAFFRDARLVLDTNVLIGLVCQGSSRHAHTNWLIEATRGLGVQLNVSPRTMREFGNSLVFARYVYERDHGRRFSSEMMDNEIIRTYRAYHSGKRWDEFFRYLDEQRDAVFRKYNIGITEFETGVSERWMKEYRRIIDEETAYQLETRPYDVVDHDAYLILQVQEQRSKHPGSFSSPWFLTYDYKLRRADRRIREVSGSALGSTISPDSWFEIIYPFLSPELDQIAVAELFVKMLGASLLPLTPASVKEFLSYVGSELGLDQKDTEVIYKTIEQTHLFKTLQRAVGQSDMPVAMETLYGAIGEALKSGMELESRSATIKRLAEKNQELTKRLTEFETEFAVDSVKLKEMLQLVDSARGPDDRKKALETLGEFLFEGVRGWKVVARDKRTKTSELDLLVENSNATHAFLREMGADIPIECKNWMQPVGSDEIRDFGRDIQKRRFSFGILVASSGITGDPKKKTDAMGDCWDFFRDGVSILVLDKDDIEKVIAGESLVGILREKARGLKLMG